MIYIVSLQLATDGILKFCLRGCLGNKQRKTFFHLLDVLNKLTSDVQKIDELDSLEKEVAVVCTEIQRDFPISIQVKPILFLVMKKIDVCFNCSNCNCR